MAEAEIKGICLLKAAVPWPNFVMHWLFGKLTFFLNIKHL